MDPSIIQALVAGQLTLIAQVRDNEAATRQAISGDGIDGLISGLFPGVDANLLSSNKNIPNYLQQGVNRYVRALIRGGLNWEWEGDGDAPPDGTPEALLTSGRDLVQSITVDALVSGKVAVFPFANEAGQLRLSVLAGFLWPIFQAGDSNEVLGLLQVLPYFQQGRTLYQVRRYTPGLLEVFGGLADWRAYATAASTQYPQPHAPDRLPVAFRIVARDANRQPEGQAMAAMPAFMRYLKSAVLLSFIAHRGGFEERVVNSDKLFELALKDPRHPLIAEMKKVGPNQVRLGGSSDRYERLSPVALNEYREAERDARADLQEAFNIPDVSGRNLSGDALVERREAYTEGAESLAHAAQDLLTEACELAAALQPAVIRPGWRIVIRPKFSRDTAGERAAIREDVKAGVLPVSAALSGLQSLGVDYVTEAMVQAAQDAELLAQTPGGIVPGSSVPGGG